MKLINDSGVKRTVDVMLTVLKGYNLAIEFDNVYIKPNRKLSKKQKDAIK